MQVHLVERLVLEVLVDELVLVVEDLQLIRGRAGYLLHLFLHVPNGFVIGCSARAHTRTRTRQCNGRQVRVALVSSLLGLPPVSAPLLPLSERVHHHQCFIPRALHSSHVHTRTPSRPQQLLETTCTCTWEQKEGPRTTYRMSITCGGYSLPLLMETKIWFPPMSCPYAAIVAAAASRALRRFASRIKNIEGGAVARRMKGSRRR